MDIIKLYKIIESYKGIDYKFGETDCFNITFRILDSWKGKNLHQKHKGLYTNRKEAFNRIKERGGLNTFMLNLGFKEIKKNYQQIGDVLINATKGGHIKTFGIYLDKYIFSCDRKQGTCLAHIPETYTIWRL